MAEAAALDSLKWVVSPLLSRLWNEVFNRLGTSKDEQHKLLQDLETISLPGLSLAIEKAENSPKRHQLENWLERLKDAYYKTEEAIDLFTYYELRQKVHDERKSVKPNIVDRIKTEVSSFASHHHMLTSTKKKITEFLQIIKEFRNYRDLLQDGDAGTHDRETVSALEEKVFGRDRDREIIVSKLTKESITDHGPSIVSGLNILAITARPGIGKTTLAKYVYNYLSKEGHFDIFMWVYVPRKFRAGDVINKMMKAKQTKEDLLVGQLIEQKDSQFELQSSSHDNYPLEGLSVEIKKMFHSKKYLLVLDDFLCCTGTDREQWKKFMSCLSCWGSESKILITTQSTEAVRQISVPEENIYKLDQLEEDLFFELFMYHASGNTSNMKDNSLEVVGRKVANKLNGDPKAAEVVGSQLRKKGDIIEWEKVSKKDWSGDEIMKSRIWSYQNLHADLQRCFAFCGLFPKGFRFVGKTLIYLWMAEGFIKSANNGKRIEDIGESYLHELVSSHFLDKRVDEEGKENYVDEEGKENQVTFIKSANYVLHDLLHDLAEQVCGANYLRMEYNNYVEIPRDTRNKLSGKENVHHLSLQASMISELKDDICKQKELRTLIIFDGDGTVSKKDLKEIIQTSEKLRVLSLPSCGIKDLPDSIGSLKHLRYIDISGCSLRKLPNSICKLYHLQVFALSSCESLPEFFSELISLRHFLTNDETVSKIREVGRLTSIQGLSEFHVEHGNSFNLEQLKNLVELRGQLRIKGLQKVTRKDDAVKAKIIEKVNLESLALEWDRNERDNDNAEILESLCPNPLIRELHIINFPGKKLPNWLLSQNSGKYLRALSLKGCAKVPNLPSFDQCFPNCIFLALGELDLVKELPPLPPKLMFSYIELPLLVSFVTTDDFQMAEERREFISMVVKQMANYCKLRDVFVPINLLSTLSSSLPPISKRLGGETNISTSSTKCKKFLSKLDRVGDPENIPTDELMDMWVTGMDCQLEMMFSGKNVSSLVLPSSLTNLVICNGSITNQALSVSFQNLYSLSSLCLSNILTITSLPPEEVLCELKHLQSIDITDCYLLTSFGGISALTSLKKLKLQGSCLEWKALSDGSVLPSELEELEFWNCANIDVIIESSKLAKLHTLKFFYCSIKKINLITLSSLAELEIVLCSQPFVLEGLSSVHALHGLRVTKCPMIGLSSPDDKLSSQITFTEIDDLSLLTLIMSDETVSKLEGLVIRSFEGGFINDEAFEYLASLNFLIIDDCQITSMPTKIKGLTNLYSLSLSNCKKLHDLTVLPEDLPELVIKDCPILEKRYGSAGPKHKHIAHIPRILFQW